MIGTSRQTSDSLARKLHGHLLVDLIKGRMPISYPLDVEFVLALPGELRPLFDTWASSRGYVPGNDSGTSLR